MRLHYGLAVAMVAMLSACGGGGDGGSGTSTPSESGISSSLNSQTGTALRGIFTDERVKGVSYECGNRKGVTDQSGYFFYEANEKCSFSIGGLVIGNIPGSPVVTPVSFFVGANDETDSRVVSLSRFLQSLDADNDPSNGIDIPNDKANQLDRSLDFSSATFDLEAAPLISRLYPGRALVSADSAKGHLRATLVKIRDGNYRCTFDGDDEGSVEVTLLAGVVSGKGYFSDDLKKEDPFTVYGSIKSSGVLTLSSGDSAESTTSGGTNTGATWTGEVRTDGQGSGTWKNRLYGYVGKWSCTRQ